MKMNYNLMRNLYYAGISVLVLYALPQVPLVTKYLYPILNFNIVPNFTVVSVIAIGTAIAAFMGWKYRSIG
jgi:hypothetical protein